MTASNAPTDPEELEASTGPVQGEISAATMLGEVELSVADLERSIGYYRDAVGLRVLKRSSDRVVLGVEHSGALLVLAEEQGARPSHGHTGLYHFALLVPERADLALWLLHAARERVRLVGLSDHFVSEALYLRDPDGHGIEIYWDRPREVWEGQVAERMTTLPLDVDNLGGEVVDAPESYDGLPAGTIMGHVHFKVSDVADTVAFYCEVLGFGLMAQLGAEAAFLAAGGYHHHVGANTWESGGASPPPPGSAALRHATIRLPGEMERDRILRRLAQAGHDVEETPGGPRVRDPSGNALVLGNAPA